MDGDTLKIIVYMLIPFGLGLIGYLYKIHAVRIDALEQKIMEKVTEIQVRQILSDKLDPLHEDLKEIRTQLEKLLDRFIKNGPSN